MTAVRFPFLLATTVIQTAHCWSIPASSARLIPIRFSLISSPSLSAYSYSSQIKRKDRGESLTIPVRSSFRAIRSRFYSSWNDEEYLDNSSSSMAWIVCSKCRGEGKIRRAPSKKAKARHHQRQMQQQQQRQSDSADQRGSKRVKLNAPLPPRYDPCKACNQTGILESKEMPDVMDCYPSIAIVGGGLGGLALGIACHHRGIPFQIFERDTSFLMRYVIRLPQVLEHAP